MKAALVLSAESLLLQQQAGEINAMLTHIVTRFSRMELWLFYKDRPPEFFPEIAGSLSGIKLIQVEYAHLPESYLQLLVDLMAQSPMDLLVFASDGLGAELATRIACRLNGSSSQQVQDCKLPSDKLEVTRPVYGNNLTARFVLESSPYCLSAAKQPGHSVKMRPCALLNVEKFIFNPVLPCRVKETVIIPDQPATGLAEADRVLVAGQGADNKETVDVLQNIANTIGAELGASRPVVMNAWTDMNRLIGSSGLIISPELCITAGVSGSGVFNMGIKNSDFIVAINSDGKAPIFQIADVGIVFDLKAVLLELEQVIKAEKSRQSSIGSGIETQ